MRSTVEVRARDAWVEIDVGALRADHRAIRAALPGSTALGVVVKADAYGHGLIATARVAAEEGADWLVVATLEEGLALREAGIDRPVLVAYPVPPAAAPQAAEADLTLTVGSHLDVARLAEALRPDTPGAMRGHVLDVHLEVDTGMTRGGAFPSDVVAIARAIRSQPPLRHAGTWSHLAQPDDPATSRQQAVAFEDVLRSMRGAGVDPGVVHLSASGGLLCGEAPMHDLARIGLAWYGVVPEGWSCGRPALAAALRPALAVRARAIRVARVEAGTRVGYGGTWTTERPSVIATLPIGYADGIPRSDSPGAEVLVRGRRVPLVGRVSMDALTVDATRIDALEADEIFTLIGRDGDAEITVSEIAHRRGTIEWEVLATLGTRLPRIVVRGPGDAAARHP